MSAIDTAFDTVFGALREPSSDDRSASQTPFDRHLSELQVQEYPFEYWPSVEVFAGFGAPAVPRLLSLLDDPSMRVRWYASLGLATMAEHGELIAEGLMRHVTHPHGLFRRQVRWLLRRLSPASLPVLQRAFTAATAEHRAALADILGYLGRSAAPAIPLLEAARPTLSLEETTIINTAIEQIRGPWDSDPAAPIEYLGEHLGCMDERLRDGVTTRRDFEVRSWCDSVCWASRHLDEDAPALLDASAWSPEAEDLAATYLDRWRPDRVVIARPRVTLVYYRSYTGDEASHEVSSDDGQVFTMEELLYKALQLQQREENEPSPDRIFEGLQRRKPGVYYVKMGS